MTNIKNTILNIVENNKVKMIPRWKFILYSALAAVGLAFAVLTLIFLASLIIFILATSGFVYLPLFGLRETMSFLISVPVFLFVLAIIMLFVTETLTRKHEFAFKKPIFVTLASITALSIIVGFVISQTPLHFFLRDYIRSHHIDMMRPVYDRPLPFEDTDDRTVIRGTILSTSSNAIEIKMFDGNVISVIATGTFPLPSVLEIGNDIVVFGSINDDSGIFEALRIRPLGQGGTGPWQRSGYGGGYGHGMMREINIVPAQ